MTNTIKNHFDALVVGGGILGMLTARNLQSAGLQVALIEKDTLGSQATWAAGGILSTLSPWHTNASIQPLVDEGQKQFANLAAELKQETGIDPEYVQSGMLVLDSSEYEQAKAWAKEKGIEAELLEREQLSKLEPLLAKTCKQAIYIPELAQIRPPKLIQALRESLQQRNIKIIEHTEVSELQIENECVNGVKTSDDDFYTGQVFLCSGAWSQSLLKEKVDIEPVRGQMLLYKPEDKVLSRILLKEKAYLIPRQDGHLLCGSTVEHAGFENQITQQACEELKTVAEELLPELAKLQPVKQWSGLRPGTQRDAPYICKHPDLEGLYLNFGHFRYGILMSIASARMAAEIMIKSQNSSQIAALA